MADKRIQILFLCTGNSCRSQMAEALLREMAPDRFEAFSAGSHPAGFVHPLAVEAMRCMHIPMENARSKSWDEFAQRPLDVVITVCEAAAAEACPVWSADAMVAHWPLPDPVDCPENDAQRIQFALRVAGRLRTKIRGLVELDWSLDRETLIERLAFLGEI